MTFSIVVGYFELAVNPSRRTGVKGDFLKPVKCFSDLLAAYCNVCTLHLFTCVQLHSGNLAFFSPLQSSGNRFILMKSYAAEVETRAVCTA